MSILGKIGGFFKGFGALLLKALQSAQVKGLTDEVLALALQWVKVAAGRFTDDAAKREFVVQVLVGRGIPESIARLAVELAVQALKAEAAKLASVGA